MAMQCTEECVGSRHSRSGNGEDGRSEGNVPNGWRKDDGNGGNLRDETAIGSGEALFGKRKREEL
jgi:hypothetical protein